MTKMVDSIVRREFKALEATAIKRPDGSYKLIEYSLIEKRPQIVRLRFLGLPVMINRGIKTNASNFKGNISRDRKRKTGMRKAGNIS